MSFKKKYVGKFLKLKEIQEGCLDDYLIIGNKYKIVGENRFYFKIITENGIIDVFKNRFDV